MNKLKYLISLLFTFVVICCFSIESQANDLTSGEFYVHYVPHTTIKGATDCITWGYRESDGQLFTTDTVELPSGDVVSDLYLKLDTEAGWQGRSYTFGADCLTGFVPSSYQVQHVFQDNERWEYAWIYWVNE